MPFISTVRGSFGSLGKVGITAPPLVTYNGTTYNLNTQTISLTSAGEYSITVVMPIPFRARVFGAGGGGSQNGGWQTPYVGGSGGYATGNILLPAGTHKVIVGEGGSSNTFRTTVGGGASAQPKSGVSDNRYSACGGGFSGIFSGSGTVHDGTGGSGNTTYRTAALQARALIVAGGGGGGGNLSSGGNGPYLGGHGGGTNGTGGYGFTGQVDNNSRGTQSSGGLQNGNQWGQNTPAVYMQGGHGGDQGYGGGGGGGYFGGSTANSDNHMGGGGGGSGFIHPSLVIGGSLVAGSGQTSPGGSGQSGYITGYSYGGNTGGSTSNSWNGGSGASGMVILG